MYNNNYIEIILCLQLIAYPQILFGVNSNSSEIDINSTTINYQESTFLQAKLFSNSDTYVVENNVDLVVSTIDKNKIPANIVTSPGDITYPVANKENTLEDYSLKAIGFTESSLDINDDISQNNPLINSSHVEIVTANGVGNHGSNDVPMPHDNISCDECHTLPLYNYSDIVCYWCHSIDGFGNTHPLDQTVTCLSCHYIHKEDKHVDVLCIECHPR